MVPDFRLSSVCYCCFVYPDIDKFVGHQLAKISQIPRSSLSTRESSRGTWIVLGSGERESHKWLTSKYELLVKGKSLKSLIIFLGVFSYLKGRIAII